MSYRKIFISYSHEDHLIAETLARHFLRNPTNDVWIDSQNIPLGENWSGNIDNAVGSSDVMICLLSSGSIRRREVVREAALALARAKSNLKFILCFVVIGKIHCSWFYDFGQPNEYGEHAHEVWEYLSANQFVALKNKHDLTIEKVKAIDLLANGQSLGDAFENTAEVKTISKSAETHYVFESGSPERMYDTEQKSYFYKVCPDDLAPSTVWPFAMDDRSVPQILFDESQSIARDFSEKGLYSERVGKTVKDYLEKNIFISLINSRQVIINGANLLSSLAFKEFYFPAQDETILRKQKAFSSLLEDGSFVIFLYGNGRTTPFIHTDPSYSHDAFAVAKWNNFCADKEVYCIREDWSIPEDRHGIRVMEFAETIADDSERNNLFATNFGLNREQSILFCETLRKVGVFAFCQKHMMETSASEKSVSYSRSDFYRHFINVNKNEAPFGEGPEGKTNRIDPVLFNIFDKRKPFSIELSKMVDSFYNASFVNIFQCRAQLPFDLTPQDSFVYRFYLEHSKQMVSIDELLYAFSEFFSSNDILTDLYGLPDSCFLDGWDLPKVASFRKTEEWSDYIAAIEETEKRSTQWQVDFSSVGEVLGKLTKCLNRTGSTKPGSIKTCSFRMVLGSKTIDIVYGNSLKILRTFPGWYSKNGQNQILIQFMVGNNTDSTSRPTVFMPLVLFDGKTDYEGSEAFFKELLDYFKNKMGFFEAAVG